MIRLPWSSNSVLSGNAAAPGEGFDEDESRDEASDVGAVGDPGSTAGGGAQSAQNLINEPKTDDNQGGNFIDKITHRHPDPAVGKKYPIGGQDPRDGTGGPQAG